jgi:hypothetical protein
MTIYSTHITLGSYVENLELGLLYHMGLDLAM